MKNTSKLEIDDSRTLAADRLHRFGADLLQAVGCARHVAEIVATHLVDASVMGVDSHGVMRLPQYVKQLTTGYMTPSGEPTLAQNEHGAWIVDGHDGFGIPAMQVGIEKALELAKDTGISAVAVVDCGHTGRIGEFAETGADAGCLTIVVGGGGRKAWRQVAPFGGAKGMLPTNPYAFGIPGGEQGAVVLDFATSKIAGGWIYAAESAGVQLPPDAVIDAAGNPTRNPADYRNGGAILPMAGPKGYGLALLAELIGAAMIGPITTEMNWLIVCIDTARYQSGSVYHAAAEDILHELRTCPPAAGFSKVEIPGERERETAQRLRRDGIPLAAQTVDQLRALGQRYNVHL